MAKLYTLLKADEKQVRNICRKELEMNGYTPVIAPDFIYAEGTVPVLLVAHYDTVLSRPPRWINNDKGIMSASNGLGADDRAGVFAILETIKNYHCSVLFTGGEERGGIGAEAFAKSGIKPDVNYIIELDRRGENDAVFYDCANQEFIDFVESKGWEEAWGTFSDISTIAPYIGVAAVNLSIGYMHEHQKIETLDGNVLRKVIERLPNLLHEDKKYEYVESKISRKWYGGYYDYDYGYGCYRAQDYVPFWGIWYSDKTGSGVELVEGISEAEAVGNFLMDHPTMTYDDIILVADEETYYEWEEEEIRNENKRKAAV